MKIQTGKRIKEVRLSHGMSARSLARLSGLSSGYLSQIETGKSAASGEKLFQIATVLCVTMEYLLDGRKASLYLSDQIVIPGGLASVAENLDLTYAQTIRLMDGANALTGFSEVAKDEWDTCDWMSFYNMVKEIIS